MIFRICFTFLFLTTCFQESRARSKVCPPDSPCVDLNQCPELRKLITSGNRQTVIDNICGFDRFKSRVCCKKEGAESTTLQPKLIDLSKDLLPKKCGIPDISDRIIGGTVASIAEFPWMVALGYTVPGKLVPEFECGGSLINDRYVLTAAHCLDKEVLRHRKLSVLHVGEWDVTTIDDCEETALGKVCTTHVARRPEEEIFHPDYNIRARHSDDIALVRLDAPVTFSKSIMPICLPTEPFVPEDPENLQRTFTVAGWGLVGHVLSDGKLLKVNLDVNNASVCKDIYKELFLSKQLCFGGLKGIDSCSGDSGSPMMMPGKHGPPYEQVGIVSFGFPCGQENKPGVYASVSSYMDWIKENLKP